MLEFEAPDWRELHSSLSRRRRFAFCPVGYYLYHVPGRDGYSDHPGDWHYKVYCAKHCVTSGGFLKTFFRKCVRKYFLPGADFRRGPFEWFARREFEKKFTLLERQEYLLDPKIVNEVLEISNGEITASEFYDRSVYDLHNMINSLQEQWFFEQLYRIPMVDIAAETNIMCWQLGGVNFASLPDLMWFADNQVNILDMNTYSYSQERTRSGELFRCYCWRFKHIPAEKVAVTNFDLTTLESYDVETSEEDFTETFRALSTEAAMWRDYLIKQKAVAGEGEWHYAQLDKCHNCRFARVCPACHGTGEDEYGSINF